MDAYRGIIYIFGAMFIGIGAYMVRLEKPAGAGLLTFGIILIGIAEKII